MLGFFAIFYRSALNYYFFGLLLASMGWYDRINHFAASCFNGCSRAFGHSQAVNGQSASDIAGEHNFDALDTACNNTSTQQGFNVDNITCDQSKFAGTHFCGYAANTRRKTEFRQTTLQWHLAAFKTWTNRTTRTSLLTFMTLTAGLAEAATDATSNTTGRMFTAWSRAQCIQMHDLLLTFHKQQIAYFVDDAANTRGIFNFHTLVHTTQTQTFYTLSVSFHLARWTANQCHFNHFLGHND
jgi:hypothetical protein